MESITLCSVGLLVDSGRVYYASLHPDKVSALGLEGMRSTEAC